MKKNTQEEAAYSKVVRLKKDLPGIPAGTLFYTPKALGSQNFIADTYRYGIVLIKYENKNDKSPIQEIKIEFTFFDDWIDWVAEEPERWRAELGDTYFYISNEFYIAMTNDLNKPIDKIRYELGNYFKTENVAKRAAEILKETLKKFHGEDK